MIALPDGGALPLTTLLCAAPEILGHAHVEAFGPTTPLLPKLLDVHAMLSLQAHPPGQPELYVVLAADPGATLQLGLAQPLEPRVAAAHVRVGQGRFGFGRRGDEPASASRLGAGGHECPARCAQAALATACAGDPARAAAASAWLLQPGAALPPALAPISRTLAQLAAIDAALLGTMHAIPVAPGTVVHNRIADPRDGRSSATLHALGNLQGRRILALELRVAGPTWRVWDHGRLPARALQAERALAALPVVPDDPAAFVLAQGHTPFAIDDGVLAVERVVVGPTPWRREGREVAVFVHAARGAVTLWGPADVPVRLEPGTSAWVPACWSHWHAQAVAQEAWERDREGQLAAASAAVGFPAVVKPSREGCSTALAVVRDAPALAAAIDEALAWDRHALVEEHLDGTEVTVVVLEDPEGHPRAFQPTETPPKGAFLTIEEKFLPGQGMNITPARLPQETLAAVREVAERSFRALGLRVFARIDMYVTADARIVVGEPNTLPGSSPSSTIFLGPIEEGIGPMALVTRIIETSLAAHRAKKGPLD
jgi:hypothetical protein